MTQKMVKDIISGATEVTKCMECGKAAPLLPFGKDHDMICAECGLNNAPRTINNMLEALREMTAIVAELTKLLMGGVEHTLDLESKLKNNKSSTAVNAGFGLAANLNVDKDKMN
jgi:hypothetical protein